MIKNGSNNSFRAGLSATAVFFTATAVSLVVLVVISFATNIIPSELLTSADSQENIENSVDIGDNSNDEGIEKSVVPSRIVARSVGIDTPVVIPASTDFSVLDNALTHGAVYYPDSGTISEGNMFVFGHSTGYNVVRNPAYKAFNGVGELKRSDVVEVHTADGSIYLYKVTHVRKTTADEAYINFSGKEKTLTLSTCNTFGSKDERYVAEAILVGEAV